MASPQTENGYTKIANELFDALCKIRIPGECRQVLDVIFRKTYGWNKTIDEISLSQFEQSTGIKKQNVLRSIRKLDEMNLIIIRKDNGSLSKKIMPSVKYSIQKNFDEWKPLSKKIRLSKKITSVIKKDNLPLSKKINTKDTITKDTTKESIGNPEVVKRIVNFLNEKISKNYRTTGNTAKLINARLGDGFHERDFYVVILKKVSQWINDAKMAPYLRPETLFCKKHFESYLNEVVAKPKEHEQPPEIWNQ